MEYRKLGLERRQSSSTETSVDISSDERLLMDEIGALKTVVASLPEGETKNSNQSKLIKLEHRHFLLNERKDSQGAVALLDIEFDLARICIM